MVIYEPGDRVLVFASTEITHWLTIGSVGTIVSGPHGVQRYYEVLGVDEKGGSHHQSIWEGDLRPFSENEIEPDEEAERWQ